MHRTHATTLSAALLVGLLAGPAHAAPSAEDPARTHDIEPADYFTQTWIRESTVSPDGRLVAYTEGRWDESADSRRYELWVVSTRTRKPERLTFDGLGKSGLTWSPDSRWILFAGSRKHVQQTGAPYNGEHQVWRIAPTGGDPIPLTSATDGVHSWDLSADGSAVYFTTESKVTEEPWKDLKSSHSGLEYGHGVGKRSTVWELDLTTWRTRQLAETGRVVTELAARPDRSGVALVTKPDESLLSGEGWSRVDLLEVATGAVTPLTPEGWRAGHASPRGWADNLAWSTDGDALAFTVSYDGYQTDLLLFEWAGGASRLRTLPRPDALTITGGLAWRGASRDLTFLAEERARRRVYAFTAVKGGGQGALATLTPGDVVIDHYGHDDAGRTLVATIGTPTATPDIHLVQKGGRTTRLTHANPQVDTWRLPQLSIVRWNGADGKTVEGILELPPGYDPAAHGPIPMVVEIHGGPTAASLYRFRFWIYGRGLLPAKGYAVLSPNYRGSTGYGDAFMVDLIGRENDVDVTDILAGVDMMVSRGIADPARLGVMGWSNGGYLTNCLITRTPRFKAASSGAGVLHQVMQWGTEDTPGHVINYMEGLPWDKADAYRAGSPLYNLNKVKTPTLIHIGEGDERVPVAHARTLHRALHTYLDVPAELLVYPGEGHGLSKYKHREAKMAWDLAWFGKHLGPGWSLVSPAPEAAPAGPAQP